MHIEGIASINDIGTISALLVASFTMTAIFSLFVGRRISQKRWALSLILSATIAPIILIGLSAILIIWASNDSSISELSSFVAPALFWFGVFVLPLTFAVSYFCLRSSRQS